MGLLYDRSEQVPPIDAQALFEEFYRHLDATTEPHCSCKILTFPATAEYQYSRLDTLGIFKIYHGAYGVFAEYSVNGKYRDSNTFTNIEDLKAFFQLFWDEF